MQNSKEVPNSFSKNCKLKGFVSYNVWHNIYKVSTLSIQNKIHYFLLFQHKYHIHMYPLATNLNAYEIKKSSFFVITTVDYRRWAIEKVWPINLIVNLMTWSQSFFPTFSNDTKKTRTAKNLFWMEIRHFSFSTTNNWWFLKINSFNFY